MRRVALLFALSGFVFSLAHCVADDPGSPTADAGPDDDSGADTSTTTDGSPATDGSTQVDSGPGNDLCTGFADCPTAVDKAHLQLWLRGNLGVNCSGGHVAKWTDQSGNKNDAVPTSFGKFGDAIINPECGSATLGGHEVVTFAAPGVEDGGSDTHYTAETMDVGMDWILGTEYTVFVVHRRKVDGVFAMLAQDRSEGEPGCLFNVSHRTPQTAFELGYTAADDGGTDLEFYQHCGASGLGDMAFASFDSFKPAAAVVDEVVFANGTGHIIYSNSIQVGNGGNDENDNFEIAGDPNLDGGPLPGVLGRGSDAIGVDTRYDGDIAEVIGFNSALADDDRAKIETYLKRQWGLTF